MRIKDKYTQLPISHIADEVNEALKRKPRLIVTAPPGAGKSTLLPLTLLESIPEGKILMLEPRRIAARQVAERMAEMLGENVGETVGYRVRFDTKISTSTRIEVITEGILERMLIADPILEGVEAVIFDEFHERSLSSDVTLALTREIQNILRPDLRILVMSATIEADSLCTDLDALHIESPGKMFDVKIIHGEDFDFRDCAKVVAKSVRDALRLHKGNILAFLPGQAEIMKCKELLSESMDMVEILTLYGMMPHGDQKRVLSQSKDGIRKVILATPIAETSLTINGVSVVVDSGLYRTPVFEPTTGLSRLTTARISLDMAQQRSGRAGRQMDGICYRLWSKATESRMKASRLPEIEFCDLSAMLLTLAAWGETNPLRLPWITLPPARNLANAGNLLRALGAIEDTGHLTSKGERIVQLPCHPRIASMLTEAGELRFAACDIAALLEEKDPYLDESDADIHTRIALLNDYRKGKLPQQWNKIDKIAAQYRRLIKAPAHSVQPTPAQVGKLVATAYPERIAMRESYGQYRLAQGGQLVTLHPEDDLGRHEFLAIASMGNRIFLAAPVDKDFVQSQGKWLQNITWSNREGRVVAREELRLGILTLATRPMKGDIRKEMTAAISGAAPKEGLTMFDFNEDVQALQHRIAIATDWHPELAFPTVSTKYILANAAEWLPLYIGTASSVQELQKIDMRNVIFGMLSYEQHQALDRIAPAHIKLPSGRQVRVHYRRGAEAPIVSARIQDCFGLKTTPKVDEGRRPVLMELLSPGFKPVQLTQDLEGFWRETYFEVRKELRRRYPKHSWPDNPLPD